jgi:CheY-like chemotaxis protein
LRALIVDDNATNRQILINQLLSWGMQPCAVDGADEALSEVRQAAVSENPYQVGIFDLHMPEKDGLMLTQELKADSTIPLFPLIMLTSGDSERTVREARSLGINQYVRKPIRQSDLYECLLEVLGFSDSSGISQRAPSEACSIRSVFNAHVLMAEDNYINQEVARGMFEHLGCRLEVVDNGRQAVERMMAERFDVVFMDCQMPEMDGYEATGEIRRLESLREDARHVPIVALTANALQGDREKCLAAGMDDYVSKPLNLDQLQAVLARRLAPDQAATPITEVVAEL